MSLSINPWASKMYAIWTLCVRWERSLVLKKLESRWLLRESFSNYRRSCSNEEKSEIHKTSVFQKSFKFNITSKAENPPANTPTDGGTIPFRLFFRQNFLHHHSWLRKHRTLPPRDAPHGSRGNKRTSNSGAKPKTPELRSGIEFLKWAGALGDRSERAKTRARNWRWSQQGRYKSRGMNSVKSTRQRRHCRNWIYSRVGHIIEKLWWTCYILTAATIIRRGVRMYVEESTYFWERGSQVFGAHSDDASKEASSEATVDEPEHKRNYVEM